MKGPRDVPVPARRCAVAAVLACALGCGGDAPPSVSSNVGTTWTTVPEYEIGSLHGERGSFERIADIGVSDDGTRIHVLDAGGRDVSVWTPDGSPVLSVGGEGDGPGEFRDRPRAINLTSDGFQVLDRSRIVGFSDSGAHVETISMPNSVSYRGFRFRPMGLLADGSLLAYPSVTSGYQSGWWGDDPVDHLPVVRIAGRDGGWSVDTLAVLDVTNEVLAAGNPENLAVTLFTDQPYRDSDQAIYRVESETVVVVRMGGLRPGQVDVTEISPEGNTVWSRRLSFVPLPLPLAVAEQYIEAMAEQLAEVHGSRALLGAARTAVREAFYVPEHFPPVQDLAMASNDELWMSTFEPSAPNSGRVWYTVTVGGPGDEPLRRVLLPASFSPYDVTDTHVWGSRRDAYDVAYAVGLRLVPLEEEPN